MVYVYNLKTPEKGSEYSFSAEVTEAYAACYAYADSRGDLDRLLTARQSGESLEDIFPIVFGKYGTACGDFVATRQEWE